MSKNPETVKKYNTQYYQTHKAKLLQDANSKIRCDICNSEYSKSNMSKHVKTEKHILKSQLNNLNQN